MIDEANAQYIKELKAEKEELEKNYSENANAIKLLFNGKCKILKAFPKRKVSELTFAIFQKSHDLRVDLRISTERTEASESRSNTSTFTGSGPSG